MNKVFKLKYKSGPHGDECSSYEVEILGKHTLQDFLMSLNKNEFGNVYIIVPNPETYNLLYASERERYMEIKISYKNGLPTSLKSEYDNWLNKTIDNYYSNFAYGGWGAMDYWIKIKDQE